MTRRRLSLVFAVLLGVVSLSPAQRRGNTVPNFPNRNNTDLTVKVVFPNDRSAGKGIEVSLLAAHGGIMYQQFTDDLGSVQFRSVSPGRYRLRVAGMNIDTYEGRSFEVTSVQTLQQEFVTVTPKPDANESQSQGNSNGMISAADLNIPDKARKEFEKGMQAMAKPDLNKAREHFEKATAIYPQYALAYNNIGVVNMKAGQIPQARQAFETAISVNPKTAAPYNNLARIMLGEKHFTEADQLLAKSMTAEPSRVDTLALSAETKLMMGDLDAALALARKVHSLPDHKTYAAVHLISARVLEAKQQPNDAVAEYKLFMNEMPDSPTVPKIKQAIARLSKP